MKTAKSILFILILTSIFVIGNWAYSAVFTVDNLGDADDGNSYNAADGTNTLRKCIRLANNTPVADTINFGISGTISPTSPLPYITDDGTIIDASSRWDGVFPGGQPGVILVGSGAGSLVNGLTIKGASNCHIRGLFIRNFRRAGITIYDGAKNNVIGGSAVGERNIISENHWSGISIENDGADGNKIIGNYIGTDATGTADMGNGWDGVSILNGAKNNIVGGNIASEGNIISGNYNNGVDIHGIGADNNKIIGNYIGINANGKASQLNPAHNILVTDLQITGAKDDKVIDDHIKTDINIISGLENGWHGVSIYLGAKNNIIGGSLSGERNIISGNLQNGVYIGDIGTDGNEVIGNYIGTDSTGTANFGNMGTGVTVSWGSKNNVIGGTTESHGNIIAFNNGLRGIFINDTNTDYNKISHNSMHDNVGLGIDLYNGGNDEIPAPVIISSDLFGNILNVSGNNAGENATVEIFKADSFGSGEGKLYLGSLIADNMGDFYGSLNVLGEGLGASDYIVATTIHTNNNTSEFSIPIRVKTDETFKIVEMVEGWNLISFGVNKCFYHGNKPDLPLYLEMENVGEKGFNSLAEWLNSVINPQDAWAMVIGPNGAMDSSLPSAFHSLKYMSPLSGYWVKIKTGMGNAIMALSGSKFDLNNAIQLLEGWNLIGCPIGIGYHDMAADPGVPDVTKWEKVNSPVADYVFESIKNKYSMIIGMRGAYNPDLPPAFSSLRYIVPSDAFWVKMKQGTELKYPKE